MEGLAEDVGLPDGLGVSLKLLKQEIDHLLALLFVAHDGRDLGFDVRTDHVDGGGGGLQAHAIASPLLDDLRLLQHQLVGAGHHDAVTGGLNLFQRPGYLVILRFDVGKAGEQLHEITIVVDGEAGLLGERIVEQPPGQLQLGGGQAGA